MQRITRFLLLAALIFAFVSGTTAPKTVIAQDKVTIGAILFSRDSFFQSIQAGMEAMAKDQGVELLVNIHEHDINQETKFIEDYVARGVKAIVITPESLDA